MDVFIHLIISKNISNVHDYFTQRRRLFLICLISKILFKTNLVDAIFHPLLSTFYFVRSMELNLIIRFNFNRLNALIDEKYQVAANCQRIGNNAGKMNKKKTY